MSDIYGAKSGTETEILITRKEADTHLFCRRFERLSLDALLDQRAGGFVLIGIVGHAITKFNNDPAFKMVRRGKKINL